MVILITGASHTGKTNLAHKLMMQYNYPYFCIDHLKMGLIRSGNTELTPLSEDNALTEYLWPIVREMIKTVIENKQDLIVEGCYIPRDWQNDFSDNYLQNIRFLCLVMEETYIRNHFGDICRYANAAEQRLEDSCTIEALIQDNHTFRNQCDDNSLPYILVRENYWEEIREWLSL